MITSEQINEIAAAVAKAQGSMRAASKDATNPHFKSRYADFAAIVEACRKPLADNGIAVFQDATTSERGVAVVTRLAHSSGQWVEFGPLTVPMGKMDAHGVGSAVTYAKRYALSTALGIAADEDDDGNAAAAAKPKAIEEDDAYLDWFSNLESIADGGMDRLMAAIKAPETPEAWRAALRGNARAWNNLKARAAKGAA